MATPAANLESCVAALDLIQAAVGQATNISSGMSNKFSQILSELQNSTAALELIMESVDNLAGEFSKSRQEKPKEKEEVRKVTIDAKEITDPLKKGLVDLADSFKQSENNVLMFSTALTQAVENLKPLRQIMFPPKERKSRAKKEKEFETKPQAGAESPIAAAMEDWELLVDFAEIAGEVSKQLRIGAAEFKAYSDGEKLLAKEREKAFLAGEKKPPEPKQSLFGRAQKYWRPQPSPEAMGPNFPNAGPGDGGFDGEDFLYNFEKGIKSFSEKIKEFFGKYTGGDKDKKKEFERKTPLPDFRPFMDSLKGGIISATMEGGKQLVNIFGALKSNVQKGMAAGGEGGGIAGALAGGAGALAGGIMSGLASLPSILGSVVSMISQFVSALDPAVMQQLQTAMSDLMATIGIGFRPLMQAVIPIVRKFADVLKPVMDSLAPVMEQLGNAIIDIAVPYMLIWAQAIQNLIPVVESLIPLFTDFAEMITDSMPGITFALDMFARGLQLLVGVFFTVLAAIKNTVAGIIDFGAWLISFISKSKSESMKSGASALRASADRNAEAAYKAFQKAVGPRQATTLGKPQDTTAMAAKQASYSGIADLGKNLMQSAFGSSSQEAALNTAKFTERTANGVEKLVARMGGGPAQEGRMAGVRR